MEISPLTVKSFVLVRMLFGSVQVGLGVGHPDVVIAAGVVALAVSSAVTDGL
jgi:hypothetical protein